MYEQSTAEVATIRAIPRFQKMFIFLSQRRANKKALFMWKHYIYMAERQSESNETTFATSFEESVTTYQPAINLQLTPRRKV